MWRSLLFLALVLGCAFSPPAFAHGQHYAGFVSRVAEIDPPLPGLLVDVLGGDRRLSVRNLTQATVVVFDSQGRARARLAPGTGLSWHEPRIHGVGRPPERSGLVRRWAIRGQADGRPFVIRGLLGYAKPPNQDGGGGNTALVVAAVALGAVLVVAALALPRVLRKGEG